MRYTFFPNENISAKWNACDYGLHFNTASSINTAADLLSSLEIKITEKVRLKIREDIPITPIEVTTSSLEVADEEQIFFTQVDNKDESNIWANHMMNC